MVTRKRAAVLLTVVDTLLGQLDKLAENPDFVDELQTFTELTAQLRDIKGRQRNGLVRVRAKVAQAQQARRGEAQVAAAAKEAAAALATAKALREKAAKAAKDGNAKALASIKAQAKAFKVPLDQAATAKLSQLMAKALLFVNKSGLEKDAADLYERDGEKLTAKVNAAGVTVAETLRLKVEIEKMAIYLPIEPATDR